MSVQFEAMRNPSLFAIPLAVILSGLSILHAYWALGGRWGNGYTVPIVDGRRSINPGPVATWVVCGLLAMAALIVVGRAGWISIGPFATIFKIGVWGIGFVFLLRTIGDLRTFGFFKTVKGTDFARFDTWLYSPLCVVLALLAAGLAMSRRAAP
jgi:hypothetical protein